LRPAQLAWLIALGAIWGASFLFMKIAVPAFGPSVMMGGRIGIGAAALSLIAWFIKKSLPRGAQWKPAIITGIFYAAIPLWLWGYAAQQLSASLLSIINATAPLFAALLSLLWLREKMSARGLAGLALGFVGVAVLVGGEGLSDVRPSALSIAAAFLASLLYGAISNYWQTVKGMDVYSNVLGSLWVAALAMVPLMILFPVRETPGLAAWGSVAALGVLCTAVAYVGYFRLIEQIGAAPALTTTYLIPVFGTLWGVVFLGEHLGVHHVLGAAMIISGIALVAQARRRTMQ
jgi:drug/metabolite transporter (DMT)-like permease